MKKIYDTPIAVYQWLTDEDIVRTSNLGIAEDTDSSFGPLIPLK